MGKYIYRTRLFVIFFIFIVVFFFYIGRLVSIQLFKSPYLTKLAQSQHNTFLELKPKRGRILDRYLNILAIDCKVDSIYAISNKIPVDKKQYYAKVLSDILSIDKDLILKKLKKNKSFVWIKREVDKSVSEKLIRQELKGISLIKEYKRFYPNGSMASHIIGFTGIDDVGLEGVELAYDGYLRGSPGWRWTVRDAKRRDIISEDIKYIPPLDGLDVILTIDEAIQHIIEREAQSLYERYKAKSVTIIVMDPQNGDILGLTNRPTFDLNKYSSSPIEYRRNRAIADIYEPGSIFKIVTASCALENNLVDIEEKFFCENGEYYVGGRILHDHKPYGYLSFREIIEKSSNIGVTKIAQIINKERLYRFIKLFGFGELTGVDLPGEVKGVVRPPVDWSAVSISSIPIGQEIAVTSIQLITALSAIANGGNLIKPRVVKEIRNKDGDVIKRIPVVIVRRVISEKTARLLKKILQGVVERGTGIKARLDKYTVAGKTGTAQKAEPNEGYSHKKFVASFMGFAPVVYPKIAILISVDEPHPIYYGGSVAAPAFREIAKRILRYLKIEPDRPAIDTETLLRF